MMGLVVKQSLREIKLLLKNYWTVIVGMGIGLIIFFDMLVGQIYQSSFSLADHMLRISCVICALELFSILFQKTLVFIIHPATMHYCFNSGYMDKIKRLYFYKKCLTKLLLAALICPVLYNFRITLSLFVAIITLFLYFMMCSLIRWMKYNGCKWLKIAALFLLSSLLFIFGSALSGNLAYIPSAFLCVVFVVVVSFQNKAAVNWAKYYEDISYTAKSSYASRHKLMGEMAQITKEHVANREHSVKLYQFPLSKKNVLFFKALLETLRMSKQVMVILGLLLVFAVTLNRTSLFSQVPLINEPLIAQLIGIFSIAAFITNLKEIYFKQILAIKEKHTAGFFIPYKSYQIVWYYAVICCSILTLVLLLLCMILGTNILVGLGVIIGFDLVLLLSFLLLYKGKGNRIVTIITNMIFLFGSHLLF